MSETLQRVRCSRAAVGREYTSERIAAGVASTGPLLESSGGLWAILEGGKRVELQRVRCSRAAVGFASSTHTSTAGSLQRVRCSRAAVGKPAPWTTRPAPSSFNGSAAREQRWGCRPRAARSPRGAALQRWGRRRRGHRPGSDRFNGSAAREQRWVYISSFSKCFDRSFNGSAAREQRWGGRPLHHLPRRRGASTGPLLESSGGGAPGGLRRPSAQRSPGRLSFNGSAAREQRWGPTPTGRPRRGRFNGSAAREQRWAELRRPCLGTCAWASTGPLLESSGGSASRSIT